MNKDSPRIIKEALTSIETFDSIVAKITTCSFVLFIQSLLRLRFELIQSLRGLVESTAAFVTQQNIMKLSKNIEVCNIFFQKKSFLNLLGLKSVPSSLRRFSVLLLFAFSHFLDFMWRSLQAHFVKVRNTAFFFRKNIELVQFAAKKLFALLLCSRLLVEDNYDR